MREEYCNIGIVLAIFVCEFDVVYGRECYNVKEEPNVRDCPNGCCGDDYAQYCCDTTLQIVGSAIGAALVLAAIISAVYCCYLKKRSKRRMAQRGGQSRPLVARFGFRTRQVNNDSGAAGGPRQRPRVQTQPGALHRQLRLNPAYLHTIPIYNIPAGQSYNPPTNPASPMPPPYSMNIAPPPYTDSKSIPPPPEYNSVVHGLPPTYKANNTTDNMPPPSN